MTYRVKLRPQAIQGLKKIAEPDRVRIGRRIDALAENPRSEGMKKLLGAEDLYRIRVGDYRVIYMIQDDVLLVLVVRVGHRKDIYRRRG